MSKISPSIVLFICMTTLHRGLVDSDKWNSKDFLKKDHSFVRPYSNDDKWILVGSAVKSNSYIRLTPDQQSRKGAIWNNVPCRVKNWEVHLHYKVFGSGSNMYGDGFALWYARDRAELGPVFGSKDFFYGLGVFFDTYSNQDEKHDHGFPYISAMVNNGSLHYDHEKDGSHTQIAGCEVLFRGSSSETYVALRYENQKLTVSHDIEDKNSWVTCFSIDNVWLPTGLYFGVSAATGGLSDNHDILSLKVYDISSKVEDEDISDLQIVPSVNILNKKPVSGTNESEDARSDWSFAYTLFVVLFVIISSGLAVMLYLQYRHKTNKKRLY